jgi:hypothetical protein
LAAAWPILPAARSRFVAMLGLVRLVLLATAVAGLGFSSNRNPRGPTFFVSGVVIVGIGSLVTAR